jgi:adenine phosphoribosyltransferase
MLKEPKVMIDLNKWFVGKLGGIDFDYVAGLESRGFLFGPQLAYAFGKGFIPIRKLGKLPGDKVLQTYDLEYGTDTIEIQADAIEEGSRVVIIDDLIGIVFY